MCFLQNVFILKVAVLYLVSWAECLWVFISEPVGERSLSFARNLRTEVVSGNDLGGNLLKDFFKPRCFLTSLSEAVAISPLRLLSGVVSARLQTWPRVTGCREEERGRELPGSSRSFLRKNTLYACKDDAEKNKISLKVNTSFNFPPLKIIWQEKWGKGGLQGSPPEWRYQRQRVPVGRSGWRLSSLPSRCARHSPRGTSVISRGWCGSGQSCLGPAGTTCSRRLGGACLQPRSAPGPPPAYQVSDFGKWFHPWPLLCNWWILNGHHMFLFATSGKVLWAYSINTTYHCIDSFYFLTKKAFPWIVYPCSAISRLNPNIAVVQ